MDGAGSTGLKLARFLDYEDGSLLLLTEDFDEGAGELVTVRPGFSWWVTRGRGTIGFSIDGIDSPGPLDRDFLAAQPFRVSVPQFRLANAGVYEVAAAARLYFVKLGRESFVSSAYQRAASGQDRGDPVDRLYDWLCLYHVYGHIDGLYWMGCAFLELGMPEEARRWLGKYVHHHPGDSWGQRNLGYACYLMKDNHAARRHLRLSLATTAPGEERTDAAQLLSVIEDERPGSL